MNQSFSYTAAIMRNRISKALVVGVTALSLAASALATAEPAAAQWRVERDGAGSWRGVPSEAGPSDPYFGSPWGSPGDAGGSAPDWSDDFLLAGSPNLFRLWRLARQPAHQRVPVRRSQYERVAVRLPVLGDRLGERAQALWRRVFARKSSAARRPGRPPASVATKRMIVSLEALAGLSQRLQLVEPATLDPDEIAALCCPLRLVG